jgi:hypothetical protein
VGIPLTVGFRPQLLVVSGLSVGIPLTMGFRLSRSLQLSRSPFTYFPFSRWNFGYQGAFHKLFLSDDGISAIKEPFTNFSFTRWNFDYQGAFHKLFLSDDGILAIKEPFTNFFFQMMEFWLSRSLSQTFFSYDGISRNARIWGRLFSYISQRVFTQDPPR